jgi:hypothetical protein
MNFHRAISSVRMAFQRLDLAQTIFKSGVETDRKFVETLDPFINLLTSIQLSKNEYRILIA